MAPRSPLAAWKGLPLARQLFLAMFAAVVVVASGYFAFDIWATNRRLVAMERSTLEAVFPILDRIIGEAMVHKSPREVRELFSVAGGDTVAEKMYLLDAEGRGVDIEDLAEGRSPRRFTPPAASRRNDLQMDFPMRSRAACVQCHGASKPLLGYVRLVSPHAEKARSIAAHVKSHLVVISLMTLVLGVWSMTVVRVMIERPLARIHAAMGSVRQGRLDTRIAPVPEGEFGLLSTGFNRMIEDLDRDRRQIVDLHRRQVAHMERLVAVGELAAQLAHEIRNPLTGISSAIQVMQREVPAGAPRGEVLQKILSQLTRMDQTMGNFLRYARIPEAVVRPFDLREVLQRVLFLLEPRMKSQKVELCREIDSGLPELTGDPSQIEQALLNIGLNAVQAMPSGGRLTVAARRENGSARLEVTDTGAGIPPEQLETIFQPFFTTRENGSGLGLPISRQIVAAHAGELWLESVPGRGTTAHMRLPIGGNGA